MFSVGGGAPGLWEDGSKVGGYVLAEEFEDVGLVGGDVGGDEGAEGEGDYVGRGRLVCGYLGRESVCVV